MDDVEERVEALSDGQALTMLAAVLERRGFQLNAEVAQRTEAQVREALHQPEVAELLAPVGEASTPGEVARLALGELARRDDKLRADIGLAMSFPAGLSRLDPVLTLVIGTLVLYAFHADLELSKEPDKGWTFKFRTKPLKDSTVGQILAKLFTMT